MDDKTDLQCPDDVSKPISGNEITADDGLRVTNPRLAAIMFANKPDPWGPGYIRLYFCCLLVFLYSTMNGFDGSFMGSINADHNYTTYYNLRPKGNSGTGTVFAIFSIGQMVGALLTWIADWQGRRLPIFVGCLGVCIGTVVTNTARTLSAFVSGRFFLSFFATFATTAGPLYLACAAAGSRDSGGDA